MRVNIRKCPCSTDIIWKCESGQIFQSENLEQGLNMYFGVVIHGDISCVVRRLIVDSENNVFFVGYIISY